MIYRVNAKALRNVNEQRDLVIQVCSSLKMAKCIWHACLNKSRHRKLGHYVYKTRVGLNLDTACSPVATLYKGCDCIGENAEEIHQYVNWFRRL